jgi:hypothetical protein
MPDPINQFDNSRKSLGNCGSEARRLLPNSLIASQCGPITVTSVVPCQKKCPGRCDDRRHRGLLQRSAGADARHRFAQRGDAFFGRDGSFGPHAYPRIDQRSRFASLAPRYRPDREWRCAGRRCTPRRWHRWWFGACRFLHTSWSLNATCTTLCRRGARGIFVRWWCGAHTAPDRH